MDLIGWQYASSLIIDHLTYFCFATKYICQATCIYINLFLQILFLDMLHLCFRYHLADDGPYLENAEDYKESGIYLK